MRHILISVAAAATFLTAGALAEGDRQAQAEAKNAFVTDKLAIGDWSAAEAELLAADVAPEDQVFAKLNLAFVYSTTGRRDQAVAIYNEILASNENPYALTVAGEPRRVKTIAKVALNRLGEPQ